MSVLERELFELIDASGLPRPHSQFPHPGRVFTKGCVDAAYVDAKLVIEVDGRAWHTRIADIKRDRDRDDEAARAGLANPRLLYEHVVDDPAGTAELIRDVRRERFCSRVLIPEAIGGVYRPYCREKNGPRAGRSW